jgi:histidine triad (HIT) family protein
MIDQECAFCDIVTGASPVSTVHEDEELLAIMDIRPVTTGHLLVIPKRHSVGLTDLAEDTGAGMWRVAHRLAGALRRSTLRCAGVNFFLADGEAAGQEVWHVHLHVFPRFAGDGFRLSADWRTPSRTDIDAAAASIRAAL